MKIKRPLIFKNEYFILLLPFFFVFHGFTENYFLIPVPDALSLLLYYLMVAFLLVTISFFIFQSWRKASLFTVSLLSFHFFFGSLHDRSKRLLGNTFLTSYTFVLLFSLILFISWFIYLKKTNRSFNKIIRYINFLLAVLIFIDIALLISKTITGAKSDQLSQGLVKCDSCAKPDVYLIIADEYAGHQELQDIFHFDNAAFENALQQRGFTIVPNTRSNYNFTPFSVASILNFSYLPLKNPGHVDVEEGKIMELIKNNALWNFFSANGYKVNNNSYFDLAGQPTETSENFLPAKTKFITAQTFVSRMYRDIYFNLITRFHIKKFVDQDLYFNLGNNKHLYDKTINTSLDKTTPKFSYTHLMLPHYPFYYDENGRLNAYDTLFNTNNADKYIGYLKYANKKFIVLIDAILKNSEGPPVIILMSDHGFRHYANEVDNKYKFMNFCALYLPDKKYNDYYAGLSNVNLFRIFLNSAFHQHLPLLSDSTILLKD